MSPDLVFRVIFIFIYLLTLAASSALFHLHRHHPSLQPRVPPLTQLGIACHAFSFLIFNLESITVLVPCYVVLWNVMVLMSCWLWTIEGRFLRLWVLYRSSQWNLKWIIDPIKHEKDLRLAQKIQKQGGRYNNESSGSSGTCTINVTIKY